ncbi:MAG: PKD domain-containing protein [Bacteroidia bacterium]
MNLNKNFSKTLLKISLIVLLTQISTKVFAQPAGALNFDGNDDHVSLPDMGTALNTNALTVECWFNTTDVVNNPNEYRTLVSKWHTGGIPNMASFTLVWANGSLQFWVQSTTNQLLQANSGMALNDGMWHHVAGVFNGTTAKIYIDGVLKHTAINNSFGTLDVANSLQYFIGTDDAGVNGAQGDRFFEGSIEEVRIWNRALQACEIENNLNCELSLPKANLVAYYKFNQGNVDDDNTTITSLIDETGTYDGSLVGLTLNGTSSNFVDGNISGTCSNITLPTVSITNNTSTTQCLNLNSYDFTSNVSGGATPYTYHWVLNGSNIYTQHIDDYTFHTPGGKVISLTVTDDNGCTAFTSTPAIVYNNPTAVITTNQAGQCLTGNEFDFSSSASTNGSGTINNWQWLIDGNNYITSDVNDLTFVTSGSKSARLVVTDNFGCSDTANATVNVWAHPAAPSFTINDNKQCFNGHTFSFNDNTNLSLIKVWDVTHVNSATPLYTNSSGTATLDFDANGLTFGTNGTFNAKFTVTDNNGCSSNSNQMFYIYPEPNAAFIVNDAGQCRTGNSFVFTNQSTIDSGAVVNSWAFGDLTSSMATNPSAKTYASAGTYNVRLAVTSVHGGCSDTVYLPVEVYPHPTVKIGIANSLLCARKINFVDSSEISVGSITGWNWNFGDLTSSNLQNPQKDYASGGSKTVTLTVTSDQNCSSTGSRTINLINAPIAQMNVLNPVQCLQTNSFTFHNLSQPVHPSWITGSKWFFGNGDTSINTFPNPYSYDATGTYTVKLVVYSTTGCTDTTQMNVTVNGANAPNFTVNNPTCSQTLSFVNSQPSGNFIWHFGDGNTSTAVNPTHTYATPGTYNVKLVSYGAGCANDSITKQVGVGIFPVANFTFVAGSACSEKVVFTNTSTIGSGTMTYLWNFGDATTSTSVNPSKSYSSAGSYNVTLTATSSAGCVNSISKTVNANSNVGGLNASFTWAPGTGSCLTRINFTNTSTGATGYIWQFHDGFSSSNVHPHKTYPTTGNFLVRLIAFDNNGCSDTAEQIVNINTANGNALKASFTTASQTQCLTSNSFNFFNNSYDIGWGWGGTYSWDFGDGTTSNNTFIYNKKYNSPGIYTVSLYAVANSNGCKDTAQMVVVVLPSPTVNFDFSTGCGTTVSYNNLSTGATTYNWNFGDANTSTLVNPTHTYASAGWYFTTLTATASNGCSASISKSVVPSGGAAPVAAFTYSTNPCSNAITFTSTTQSTLNWDFGDGNTATGNTVTHSYATSGTYDVMLVAGVGGCADTLIVSVNALATISAPTSSFNLNFAGCDTDVEVENNSTNATNYKIYVDGILVYNGATPNDYTILNASVGTHHVSVVASNGMLCKDSTYQSFNISAPPVASFTYATVVCGGGINFTNTSTGAVTYFWDFGDATTSVLASPSKGYSSPGTYNVMLVAFNSNGCSDTTYASVNAVAGAPLPTVSFTHAPGGSPCTNKINFTNTTVGSGLSFVWNFGDGNTSTQLHPKKGYAYAGTYTVTLTATNAAGCSASASSIVSIGAGNGPSASFYTDQQVQCITNNNFNFYNNSMYMGTSFPGWINNYQWDFGDGTSDNVNTFVFGKKYNTPGNYTVRLVATSTDGCRDTMTLVVKVQALPCGGGIVISNPENSAGSEVKIGKETINSPITSGIKNKVLVLNSIGLYPNPNNGSFTLSFNNDIKGKITVTIHDMIGKNLYTETNTIENRKLTLSDLNLINGQYLISIYNDKNEMIGLKKFTVAR